MSADSKETDSHNATVRARFFAVVALGAFASAAACLGSEGYRAATDSFVAPMILSPESEVVLQIKMKMNELEIERGRIVDEVAGIDADLAASEKALVRLRALGTTLESSLEWTRAASAHQAWVSGQELTALSAQKTVLLAMAEKQSRIAKEANANLASSLISKTDQTREQLASDQAQLALLDNARSRVQHQAALNQAYAAQRSLSKNGGMLMPEAIAREEQTVRIEIETARLESEQRAKRAEKKVVLAKLAKMDELEAQLKGRPLFRATDKAIEVAFVPYTQIDGVVANAVVYDCIWSVFRCKPVGSISELVPGEVILPDPWGNPARGQYVVLRLDQHAAARSKVLRVRSGGATLPSAAPDAPQAVSVR